MKVMYLLFSFTVGGTERLVVDICNEMIQQNNEVHLYIINDCIDYLLIDSLNQNVKVELQRRKVGQKNLLETSFKIYRYIKKNKISIIHCNSINTPEVVILSKLLEPTLRIFYTIHSLDSYKLLNKSQIKLRNILCERIIAISESVKKELLIAGAKKEKTIVLYNGRNLNSIKCERRLFNKKTPCIGCMGRIVPEIKGQDLLVKAIKNVKMKYPKVVCYFGGDIVGSRGYRSLLQMVEENNLKDNVSFLGMIEDVAEFYSKIDIAVIPSRQEGFGLSFVEAMSLGIPSIASNAEGLKEVVDTLKVGILFEMENEVDLALKITDLIDNYEIYEKRFQECAKMVRERFSISAMCTELKNVYSLNY